MTDGVADGGSVDQREPEHQDDVEEHYLPPLRPVRWLQRPAALRGEVTWGPWRFNPDTCSLETEGDAPSLSIPLSRCTTSAGILDLYHQVAAKPSADEATVANLVWAIDELLHPQANICSWGVERGPVDIDAVFNERRPIT